MGQYYLIANLTKKEYFPPWPFGHASKLMEFSYFASKTMLYLCHFLETEWKNDMVVIIGDYYDDIPPKHALDSLLTSYYIADPNSHLYNLVEKNFKEITSFPNVKIIEYIDETISDLDNFIESLIKANKDFNNNPLLFEKYNTCFQIVLNFYQNKFFVSLDSKVYINLHKYFKKNRLKKFQKTVSPYRNSPFFIPHPVSLLLALGNGLGGGDYYGINKEYVGSLAFKRVAIVNPKEINLSRFNEWNISFKDPWL